MLSPAPFIEAKLIKGSCSYGNALFYSSATASLLSDMLSTLWELYMRRSFYAVKPTMEEPTSAW